MTVSYQYEVASSTSGGFMRLLFRWRGSVWKLVYREMFAFTSFYVLLTIIYRFVLLDVQKRMFEKIVFFCSAFMDLIPLSFVLGFFVSFTATRWWHQYIAIPWPDKLMNILALYVNGADDTSRMLRRTFMRYLNVTLVLVLRSISMAVKRRFPTKDHLVEAGFMTKQELEMLQSVPSNEFNTFWIPCTWFINLLRDAKQSGHVSDSNGLKLIMEEFNDFRGKCGMLWSYDWISVPLVYTQVVTLATYAFYLACIFGRQYVEVEMPSGHRFEYYVPIFTILELFFYMGLLKVAEQLINPFGDDDEDFELNWIIDRHMKVSYLGIDTLNGMPPPLIKDDYFDKLDVKLPYTEASVSYKKKTYRGSVAKMHVPEAQQGLVLPDIPEEEEEETFAEQFGLTNRRASTWTIVAGKFHNRLSSSQLNLENASLESGMENWKSSNFSLNMKQPEVKTTRGTWGTSGPFIAESMAAPDQADKTSLTSYSSMAGFRKKCEQSALVVKPLAPHKSAIKSLVHQLAPKSAPHQGRVSKLLQKAKDACAVPQKQHPPKKDARKYKWTTFNPEERPKQEGISLCNLPRGSMCEAPNYYQDTASLFNFRGSSIDDIPSVLPIEPRKSLPSEILERTDPDAVIPDSQDADVLVHSQPAAEEVIESAPIVVDSPLPEDSISLQHDSTAPQHRSEDPPGDNWMYSQSLPNVSPVFIFADPDDSIGGDIYDEIAAREGDSIPPIDGSSSDSESSTETVCVGNSDRVTQSKT